MVRSQHLNNLTIFINPINIHLLRVNVYGKWAEKGEIFVYFVSNFNIKTVRKLPFQYQNKNMLIFNSFYCTNN